MTCLHIYFYIYCEYKHIFILNLLITPALFEHCWKNHYSGRNADVKHVIFIYIYNFYPNNF